MLQNTHRSTLCMLIFLLKVKMCVCLCVCVGGGAFIKATSTLDGKALRSLYSLKSILREVQVPVNMLFNLFMHMFDLF